jgi:hypothetical protein
MTNPGLHVAATLFMDQETPLYRLRADVDRNAVPKCTLSFDVIPCRQSMFSGMIDKNKELLRENLVLSDTVEKLSSAVPQGSAKGRKGRISCRMMYPWLARP